MNLPSNATVATRGHLPAFFESLRPRSPFRPILFYSTPGWPEAPLHFIAFFRVRPRVIKGHPLGRECATQPASSCRISVAGKFPPQVPQNVLEGNLFGCSMQQRKYFALL
jgi:hypothetical protein